MPCKPRRSRQKKSKYLFVVATEGYRTEPIYFHYFNPEPGEGGCRFDVLNHRNKNHPDELIDRLVAYRGPFSFAEHRCLRLQKTLFSLFHQPLTGSPDLDAIKLSAQTVMEVRPIQGQESSGFDGKRTD